MAEDAWVGDTHTKVGRLGSAHNLYTVLPRTTAAYLTLCNGRLTAQECLQPGDRQQGRAARPADPPPSRSPR